MLLILIIFFVSKYLFVSAAISSMNKVDYFMVYKVLSEVATKNVVVVDVVLYRLV